MGYVAMDLTGHAGFYGAPFPSDARRDAKGHPIVAGFPGADGPELLRRVIDLLEHDVDGFGVSSGVFFGLTGPIDPSGLPDAAASLSPSSPVLLAALPDAPGGELARAPVSAAFAADGGPFGAPNLLSLLPVQGVPLRAKTTYAAVVRRGLRDAGGLPLGQAPAVARLAAGERPDGLGDAALASYRAALDALERAGVPASDIAGLTVFTTGDPMGGYARVDAALRAAPAPKPDAPFVRHEVFDDYCVYEGTIRMPDFQEGTPPFADAGGAWAFDAAGAPVLQRSEQAHFVITVPRRAMPKGGFPLVVLSRTGAGGDRPLVDRGVQPSHDAPALVPGTGPALYFAKAGFAGSSIDGPHGGLRNVTHGDEQFLMFNVGNPRALRDNVRQSAVELALQARVLEELVLDASDCPGVSPAAAVRFDAKTMALMGHSMGATIAPLALAFEPRFRAGLLSGAGGSWIENVVYKRSPLVVKPLFEALLGIIGTGFELGEHDPVLSLFQWAGEPADPPVYAARIARRPVGAPPRHVLMMQGIVDTYILPPIANAASLSLGLDLAGRELDGETAALSSFTPLGDELGLVGRRAIPLPAGANAATDDGTAKVTVVVVQHPSDGIEDGHEVVFQTDPPKREYRCFLQGLAAGAPRVPSPGPVDGPCD
jgi:hypothetical protein